MTPARPRRRRTVVAWILVGAGIVVVLGAAVLVVVFVGALLGWFGPHRGDAERKVAALEQHLRVGETRADLERQFGGAIPKPEEILSDHRGTAVSQASDERRIGRYGYVSGSTMCATGYLGVAVTYDDRDRAVRWKRYEHTEGC